MSCPIFGLCAPFDIPVAPRYAVEPPPMIELFTLERDPNNLYRSSPNLFCQTELVSVNGMPLQGGVGMTGVMVSSIHRVKIEVRKKRENESMCRRIRLGNDARLTLTRSGLHRACLLYLSSAISHTCWILLSQIHHF